MGLEKILLLLEKRNCFRKIKTTIKIIAMNSAFEPNAQAK